MAGEGGAMQLHFAPADEELVLAALKDGHIQVGGGQCELGQVHMTAAQKTVFVVAIGISCRGKRQPFKVARTIWGWPLAGSQADQRQYGGCSHGGCTVFEAVQQSSSLDGR